ncbi:MAG TPA: caspase family protein, partial [Ideonella sp.]|uniref:caspase family protein n=1 Tax=Ideonella sp. TaxID=1929293 RepID=UPI002B84015D
VDFALDGRLVTSCYDGIVRLFDAQGKRIAQRRVEGGARPLGVRFSPDGQRIAVGFYDSTAVRVLSGRDLALLYSPDTRLIDRENLSTVAWSADGQWLYAAGQFSRGAIAPVVAWPNQGRGAPVMRDAAPSTIMDLAPLADGRLAYASAATDWGVLKPDGRRERSSLSAVLDHRNNQPKFRLSGDARRLEFGFDTWDGRRWSRPLARFDLGTRSLQTDVSAEAGLKPPRIDGQPVSDWSDNASPKFNGQPIAELQPYEYSRSLAVAADGSGFVLGADWHLLAFDATGRQRWQTPVPGAALAVNVSEDGRFVVATLGDGTIRWFDAASGAERLALFIHAQDKRWVLFTPEGFYQASPGGDAMIGYHLNQGTGREGLFIDSAQLAEVFFRPDLITKRLAGDEDAITQAVKAVGDVRTVLAAGRPPAVELLSPAVARSDGEVDFSVRITPGSGPVGALMLTINGAEVPARTVSPPGGGVVTQRLSLAPGDNVVGLRATRADGKVASNEVQMRVQVTAPTQLPVLRVLAVGISQYDDATYRSGVKFAARDAEKLVEQLRAGGQSVYREVDWRLLNRRQDTSLARIDDELQALARRARPEDVVVIFLAGHGKAPEGKEYHFIPADFIYDSDQAFNRGKTLSHGRLEAALKNLGAGKRLLILDTCDSGSAVVAGRDGASEQKDALARLMRSTGRYILAAASQQGKALEDGVGGHGVYTAALLEGMAGKAGQRDAPMVDVDALAEYVARRVPELTRPAGYEQRPMRSAQGENFPLLKRPQPR